MPLATVTPLSRAMKRRPVSRRDGLMTMSPSQFVTARDVIPASALPVTQVGQRHLRQKPAACHAACSLLLSLWLCANEGIVAKPHSGAPVNGRLSAPDPPSDPCPRCETGYRPRRRAPADRRGRWVTVDGGMRLVSVMRLCIRAARTARRCASRPTPRRRGASSSQSDDFGQRLHMSLDRLRALVDRAVSGDVQAAMSARARRPDPP